MRRGLARTIRLAKTCNVEDTGKHFALMKASPMAYALLASLCCAQAHTAPAPTFSGSRLNTWLLRKSVPANFSTISPRRWSGSSVK